MERIRRVLFAMYPLDAGLERGGFTERRSLAAFWLGTLAISAGVALHLPMFLACVPMGYRMVGMLSQVPDIEV